MVAPKYTDDQLMEDLINGLNNTQIARKYNCDLRGVTRRKARLAKKGFSPDHDMKHLVPDGYKIRGISSYYSTNPITGEETLRGQWVKSAEDKERQIELIKETIEAFTTDIIKIDPIDIDVDATYIDHLLAVLPVGDPHIGMQAWADECGQNWDLKIAEETFCKLFYVLIKSAPRCKKAVLENLGDLFHYDNLQGVTSRSGHSLDIDGRYAKMVDVVIRILRFIIKTCLEHFGSLHIINAIGNHDDIGSMWISRLLAVAYENEPRVTVDTTPGPCSYTRFGNNLIGVHHGHTIKMAKLPGVMATDRRKDWGETEFQYWHTGHIHHDSEFRANEFPSCKVESFRTLAPKDSYGTWGGWRSGQDSKCIIYHEKYGEVSRITKNIAEVLPLDNQ